MMFQGIGRIDSQFAILVQLFSGKLLATKSATCRNPVFLGMYCLMSHKDYTYSPFYNYIWAIKANDITHGV